MHPQTVGKILTTQPFIAQAPRLHVAIISDGNGRWACSRGLPGLLVCSFPPSVSIARYLIERWVDARAERA